MCMRRKLEASGTGAGCVFVFAFCCCCDKTPTKSNLGEETVYLASVLCRSLSCREIRAETQGRILEAGIDSETIEDAVSWLSPHKSLDLLSFTTWDQLLTDGTAHSRLGSPTSISLIKKVFPQTGPQDNLMDTIPQLRFPYLRYCLGLC